MYTLDRYIRLDKRKNEVKTRYINLKEVFYLRGFVILDLF